MAEKLVDSVKLDAALTSTADAIRAKTGDSATIPFDYANGDGFKDAIEAIPSGGGGGGSAADVTFYDYDGTVVTSYSAADFANLTEMPENPTHAGLTAQGWNWSLADAKAYVADYGMLNIGQIYITASGDTELDVEFHDGRLKPYLSIAINGTVEIDWGDGSAKDTATGTSLTTNVYTPHEYAQAGSYTISIHVVSGGFTFYGFGVLQKGANTYFDVYNNAIQRIRIGNGVTSIGGNAFYGCYSLASVSIPDSVTTIGSSAFNSCNSLASVSIPNSVTTINSNAFYNCASLASVSIPDGVTTIGGNAFQNCHSLASVSIPDSVTTIGSGAFSGCRGFGEIHFLPITPPTVGSSNAFSDLPTDCKIYVPAGHLADYTGATNYPSSSTYTYVEE